MNKKSGHSEKKMVIAKE